MDYEKAYKEALNEATIAYKDEDKHLKATLERIFPELKEEEDELTWLINYISEEVHCLSMDIRNKEDSIRVDKLQKSLAWLEKQVPVYLSHDDEIMIRQLTEYFTTGKGLQNTNDTVVEWLEDVKRKLEKQGEQKIVWSEDDEEMLNQVIEDVVKLAGPHVCYYKDINWLNSLRPHKQWKSSEEQKSEAKVEPKFHKGEWAVWDNKISCHIDNIYQGKEFLMYKITDTNNMTRSYSVKGFDNNAHLWTVNDAKEGDVLATEDWVFIFEKMNSNGKPVCYCHYDIELGFRIDTNSYIATGSEICPATKEQRDILEKAMADAGYAFDFEKKDLKKVEDKNPLLSDFFKAEYERGKADAQKLAEWSEEDENGLGDALWAIKQAKTIAKDENDMGNLWYAERWLNSIKDRVWSNQGEQKSAEI